MQWVVDIRSRRFDVAFQVPVDTDLQEIIKEISIMQQCDSPFIVKYYGSYFKNTDLWVSIQLVWQLLFSNRLLFAGSFCLKYTCTT